MSDVDCRGFEERLPWFAHGGLEEDERREIEAHLEGCAACRAALASTREASALFALHLPAETIVDYALGLPLEGVPRALVETHLGHCEPCSDEVALVAAAEGDAATERPASPSERARAPVWQRPLALAATLVVVAGLAAWLALRSAAPPAAAGRVALVELAPESSRLRGADDGPKAIDRATASTLLLATDRAERFETVRARIVDPASGRTLWQASELLSAFEGAYALLLPPGVVPEGEWALELEGEREGEWRPIERYALRIGR
ncbi:MAG: zf-HC2 domain-containing protein [Holophagales bacterium]|nr:zf-HC2 domain-containing protein [Holophagales bacterium]